MLADSHCHLDWFENPGAVMENARNAGVTRVVSNATNLKTIKSSLELRGIEGVEIALGVHPVDLLGMGEADFKEAYWLVEKNIAHAVAVGEIGLDYKHAGEIQKEIQGHIFRHFIELALDNDKPIVVHARYAETQCLDILEEMGAEKVLMHWFTNSKKTSLRAVSLGYYISCGPIILSDRGSADIVKEIPLENLLLETDAPVSFMGKQSEPSWIPKVCGKVAELKGITAKEVENAAEKNFNSLFGNNL